MEVKIVLCNCKGLCPSFADVDMDTLLFEVESELDVKYTLLNAQLCGQAGNAVLRDVLTRSDDQTVVVVGACAPEAQARLFKRLLRETGFNEAHFVSVDIRHTNNEGVIERLKEAVQRAVTAVA
ncbi:MAG: hypothetical protein ACUVSV_15355 [Armatimonadota bacterium]